MMQKTKMWAAFFVLLLTAFARLYAIPMAEYRYDEAELSRLALDVAHGEEWHTKGLLSSQGLYHPPAMVYIIALPYVVTSHPLFAVVYVVFLNLIGAAALQKIALRYFSLRVALVAGVAYAVNPWVLLHSRSVLPQSFNTPFLIVGVLLGLLGFVEGRRWAQLLFLPVFSLAGQIHMAGMALLPLVAWFAWAGRRRLAWGAIAGSVALTLLTLLPFVLGLSQPERADFSQFITERDSSGSSNLHHYALERTLNLVSGLNIEHQISKEYYPERLLAAVPRPAPLWFGGMVGLLAVGCLAVWRRYRQFAPLLLLWVGLVVVSTSTDAVFPLYHYILLMLPALFMLVGVGAEWLASRLRYGVYLLPLLIALSQLGWWANLMRYVDQEYLPRYSPPLHYLLTMREVALGYDDAIILGGNAGWVWHPLLYDLACVREPLAQSSSITYLPDHPFVVIYPSEAQGAVLDESVRAFYTSGTEHLFPMRNGETPYRLFTFEAAPQWYGAAITPLELPLFENSAHLAGYAIDGEKLILDWRVTPPSGKGYAYQYFVHVLDANGERIAQIDAGFPASFFWCAGDQIITSVDFAIPAAAATLRLGMYRFAEGGGIINQNILDSAGNPAGQWVDIALNS